MCFKLYVRYLFVQAAKILCFSTHTHRESKNLMFPPPFSLSLSLVHVKLYMCFIHLCQAQKSYALSELLSICHSVSWFLILILCSILLHLLFSVSHTDKLVHSHASSSLSLSLSLSLLDTCVLTCFFFSLNCCVSASLFLISLVLWVIVILSSPSHTHTWEVETFFIASICSVLVALTFLAGYLSL